jgi:cytosine/adenosine deaminase-related metal-dependent hydrolase
MKTKITAEFVIGYQDGDHIIFNDGEVVFENDKVIFVGHNFADPVDRLIDSGHAIVSPGFIDLDALVDIDHGILDVAVPHKPGDNFELDVQRFRSVDAFDREFWQVKQRLSVAQLIMNGITTAMPIAGDFFRGWAETYEEFEDFADIAAEFGLRMYLGPSYRTFARHRQYGEPDFERGGKSMQDAFRYVETYEDTFDGLIRTFLSPCQISYLTEDYLIRSKEFSDKNNIPIRLHACEGMYEVGYLFDHFGKTTIEYLADLEFLGPLTIIPHAIYVNEMIGHGLMPQRDELELLAESGTSIIHTPIAEAHGGLALNSFSRYHEAGVNITMGTDTHPADMIQNLNFGWNLTRIFERGEVFNEYTSNPRKLKPVTAADFFQAATINGAKALCRNDIGKLSPGAKADIIIIDLNSLRVGPVEDPIRTLIMNTTGANVRDVVINGRFVMQDYQIPGLDVNNLLEEAQSCFDQFKNMYSVYDLQKRPPKTFFPDSFPVIKKTKS